jgi:protein-disulfide isomerase
MRVFLIPAVLALALGAGYFALSGSSGTSGNLSSPSGPLSIASVTPVRGAATAPVTIFEFGDFQCIYCHQWFLNTEPQILQNLVNAGRVKLVWKDFDYYGPDSKSASIAAYSAGEQGKFWEFYDYLYSHQGVANSGWASKANLVSFAQALGLNMTQFTQSFNSGKYDSLINSNFADGQKLGASGTPTFVVLGPNGKTVQLVGAQPYSAFESAVNSVAGG